MPLFKLSESRYINTEHIADISYTEAGAMHIMIRAAAASIDEPPLQEIRSPHTSVLTIELLNKELLPIRLEGESADAAWMAFRAASNSEADSSAPVLPYTE